MNKDSGIGVAGDGGVAVWARAVRGSGFSPDDKLRAGERLTLALPLADVLLRAERLPTSDPDEIAAMAANRMESESPLDPADMVFSHETLELGEDSALVLCAAAPVSACAKTLALANGGEAPAAAASAVLRVDSAAAGLVRSLAAAGVLAPSGRQPVLALEGGRAALLVLDEGRLVLVRSAGAPAALPQSLRLALVQAELSCGPESAPAPLLDLSGDPAWGAAAQTAAASSGRTVQAPPPGAVPPAAWGTAMRSVEGSSGPRSPDSPPMDLFPEAWRSALSDRRYKRLFAACGAAALALWFALVGVLWGWPAALGARQAALQREAEALAPEESEVREYRERIRLIERYSDRTFSPLEILREISLALPGGVTLKQFAYEAARRETTVEGESRGSAPAYDFSNRLKSSPLLARNDIVSGPTENRNTGKTNFRIRLSFASPESVAASQAEGGAQ